MRPRERHVRSEAHATWIVGHHLVPKRRGGGLRIDAAERVQRGTTPLCAGNLEDLDETRRVPRVADLGQRFERGGAQRGDGRVALERVEQTAERRRRPRVSQAPESSQCCQSSGGRVRLRGDPAEQRNGAQITNDSDCFYRRDEPWVLTQPSEQERCGRQTDPLEGRDYDPPHVSSAKGVHEVAERADRAHPGERVRERLRFVAPRRREAASEGLGEGRVRTPPERVRDGDAHVGVAFDTESFDERGPRSRCVASHGEDTRRGQSLGTVPDAQLLDRHERRQVPRPWLRAHDRRGRGDERAEHEQEQATHQRRQRTSRRRDVPRGCRGRLVPATCGSAGWRTGGFLGSTFLLLGFVGATVLFAAAALRSRRREHRSAVDTRTIASLDAGRHRVVGRIVPIRELPSAVDGGACVFVDVVEHQAFGAAVRRELFREIRATPFFVDDGTGLLRVDPREAQVEAAGVEEDLGLTTERRLRVGEEVEVVGHFQRIELGSDGGPYRGAAVVWGVSGDGEAPLRISYRTEPEMVLPGDEVATFLRGAGVLLFAASALIALLLGST